MLFVVRWANLIRVEAELSIRSSAGITFASTAWWAVVSPLIHIEREGADFDIGRPGALWAVCGGDGRQPATHRRPITR